jgi:hypothetical protein
MEFVWALLALVVLMILFPLIDRWHRYRAWEQTHKETELRFGRKFPRTPPPEF